MTKKQEKIVLEMVRDDYECGHSYDPFDKDRLARDLLDEGDANTKEVANEMANFYFECHSLGPVGFYNEHPKLGWSSDFKAMYA